MRGYSITRALKLPHYRVSKILSTTDQEIHIELTPYKRKPLVCSGCDQIHENGRHGIVRIVVEDLRLIEKRVYLGSFPP